VGKATLSESEARKPASRTQSESKKSESLSGARKARAGVRVWATSTDRDVRSSQEESRAAEARRVAVAKPSWNA
jgi:hypothetical protein